MVSIVDSTNSEDSFTNIVIHNQQFTVPRSPTHGRLRLPASISSSRLVQTNLDVNGVEQSTRRPTSRQRPLLTPRDRSLSRLSSTRATQRRRRSTNCLRDFFDDECPERRRRLRSSSVVGGAPDETVSVASERLFDNRSTMASDTRSVVSDVYGSNTRSSSRRRLRRISSTAAGRRRQSIEFHQKCAMYRINF